MTTVPSLNNLWDQLFVKQNNLKVPERDVLTKDGVYFRRRPDPEVLEHTLVELDTSLRNYFLLYNREREFRKKSEENCYRLEQELLNYKQKLEEANNRFHCLERKLKSMVDQPLKLKETLDRIDVLYNQMDTLIQAFVGIGSCTVIQGYSRVAFIKLCLEYLFPCRDLDVRLNTLYNALYGVLTQYEGIEVTMNEVMKPMTNTVPEKAALTGLSVKVHRLMLMCDLPSTDIKTFSVFFRYDNEDKALKDTEKSRLATLQVKPMDNASKVYEFNYLMENPKLPPKVPNVVPKLVLDVYADSFFVGSAEVSLISDKTLKSYELWKVLDSNGVTCGDLVVSVLPIPNNAKLPAVNFSSKTDELTRADSAPLKTTGATTSNTGSDKVVEPLNKLPTKAQTEVKVQETTKSDEPSGTGKSFEPKSNRTIRKPLFNPKTSPLSKNLNSNVPKAQQKSQPTSKDEKSKPEETGQKEKSSVSKLSLLFSGKKQVSLKRDGSKTEPTNVSDPNEVNVDDVKQETVDKDENVEKVVRSESSEKVDKKEKTSLKELIVKKLSTRVLSKDSMTEKVDPTVSPLQRKKSGFIEINPYNKSPTGGLEVDQKQEDNNTLVENTKETVLKEDVSTPRKDEPKPITTNLDPKPTDSSVLTKSSGSDVSKTGDSNVLAKARVTPPPAKLVPKVQVESVPEVKEKLPEKPLVPLVIAPKLLKKPFPPKKL
ncbi:hypothetical protein TpMuguga_02g00314 [Theileria parva strain Muguga]|uniref:Uncharacterized protein n=1 Tax=Theileria parva TaxID=5875 RepID=Q4N5H6_THEPA|nr:uncharacterized protein TpMuguga_02g00314 [Theileria parva strain Muguga]EAN32597.1 hypothetical protein TpMuguga_02g00314 [Theileria parva strain Muguga]|eukprot:XP_764880.1 hypothetical protein [Theileria parva strain Muguga]